MLAKRRVVTAAAPKTEGTMAKVAVSHSVENLVLNPAGSGGTRFLDERDKLQPYFLRIGPVAGGGLTVIVNAPNPAGQSILNKHFEGGGGRDGSNFGSACAHDHRVPLLPAFPMKTPINAPPSSMDSG